MAARAQLVRWRRARTAAPSLTECVGGGYANKKISMPAGPIVRNEREAKNHVELFRRSIVIGQLLVAFCARAQLRTHESVYVCTFVRNLRTFLDLVCALGDDQSNEETVCVRNSEHVTKRSTYFIIHVDVRLSLFDTLFELTPH